MKSLRLIQIGDVHYPEAVAERFVDNKDTGLEREFVDRVAANPLRMMARRLVRQTDDVSVRALLFVGDLTSFGNLNKYRECVQYFQRILNMSDVNRWNDDAIHAVPGNHDVDRDLADGTGQDLIARFEPLARAWAASGRQILPAPNMRQTNVSEDGVEAVVFSLNSCVGCGDRRYLPEGVQDEFYGIVQKYIQQGIGNDALDTEAHFRIYEQLDTPAFLAKEVEELKDSIDGLQDNVLPVILAHHNLLPQAMPRLAIYTELLNGGLVRSSLARCKHPILYLHGHIHDDPIEIVGDPRNGGGPLVTVSAPKFTEGFNVIDIQYGAKHVPLGCVVVAHRRTRGGVDVAHEFRIPLRSTREVANYGDARIAEVMPRIAYGWHYFRDVLEAVNEGRTQRMRPSTLRDTLKEAEWFGLVDLKQRDHNYDVVQVQGLVP